MKNIVDRFDTEYVKRGGMILTISPFTTVPPSPKFLQLVFDDQRTP